MDLRTIALTSTVSAASIILSACGGIDTPLDLDPPGPPPLEQVHIVAAPEMTGTVTPATGGSGGYLQVGDSSSGTPIRGVMGFRLAPIPAGAVIESAVLTVYQLGHLAGTGTQYSDLGNLVVDYVDLGPSVDEFDFGGSIQPRIGVLSTEPGEGGRSLDVTDIVRMAQSSGHARADFRIRFELQTDADGLPDLAYLNDGGDTANNGAVPMLTVTYSE